MRAKVELPVRLWEPPNFAVVYVPGQDNASMSIPIADLPADTLELLAREWVAALYKKAGKQQPAQSE